MKFLLVALSAIALTAPAHAAIVNTVSANSIATWPSPFNTASYPTPVVPSSTNEGNYGGSGIRSLAQSFTATTSGVLDSIEIAISGPGLASFNVALYSAGANDVTEVSSAVLNSYTPGANGYSANLFSDTSTQTWTGYTSPGASNAVLKFTMSGADKVPLVAGSAYIFEISSSDASIGSKMLWIRNGGGTGYTGGQAYRQTAPLNGNAARDFAIAVNTVPEPASLALLAMGFAGTLLIRKK